MILFGIPLAIGASYYLQAMEQGDLERLAYGVAASANDNLASGSKLADLQHPGADYQIGLYDSTAALLSGHGDVAAVPLVRQALAGHASHRNIAGRLAVVVPVLDGDKVTGAVLATAGRGDLFRRLAAVWSSMAGLGCVAVGLTWLVARRQARRLASPLEELSSVAARLGDGEFRVPPRHPSIPEIDSVYKSIQTAAARLKFVIERERAFSSEASHQLRTPLTGLTLALESAADAADPGPAISDALVLVAGLDETVTDMLQLLRGGGGANPVDLQRLFEDVAARWHVTAHAAERELRLVIDEDAPEGIISPGAARQILGVLVDNAAQHGRGTLTLTARDADGALAIDVAQEGPAMSKHPQELFATRGPNGTGIGLPLARTIARSEGARLILSSPDPITFTLLIPVGAGRPEAVARSS
jgi:signal transduction histidine kinase